MCNDCYCENNDKCSIVGTLPHGFCCERCIKIDIDDNCLFYKSPFENFKKNKPVTH